MIAPMRPPCPLTDMTANGHNLPFKKPRNLPFERLQYSGT